MRFDATKFLGGLFEGNGPELLLPSPTERTTTAIDPPTMLVGPCNEQIDPTDWMGLPGDWRLDFEERAAIREYDGGQSREHAEAGALAEIIAAMRAAGWRVAR